MVASLNQRDLKRPQAVEVLWSLRGTAHIMYGRYVYERHSHAERWVSAVRAKIAPRAQAEQSETLTVAMPSPIYAKSYVHYVRCQRNVLTLLRL